MSATIDGAMQETGSIAVKAMSQVLATERMPPFIDMLARLVTLPENVTCRCRAAASYRAETDHGLAQRVIWHSDGCKEATIAINATSSKELDADHSINNHVLVRLMIGSIDLMRAQTTMSTMLQAIERLKQNCCCWISLGSQLSIPQSAIT